MIRPEFAVHKLNENGKMKAGIIANSFSELLDTLEAWAGKDGREMSIVRTKLEEASFFAKKAMAIQPDNQQA